MREFGADHVIDVTCEDSTRTGEPYDLIIDVVSQRSLGDYRRARRPEVMGTLVSMIEQGSVRPATDREFPLEDGTTAMRHYLSGEFAGKGIIST